MIRAGAEACSVDPLPAAGGRCVTTPCAADRAEHGWTPGAGSSIPRGLSLPKEGQTRPFLLNDPRIRRVFLEHHGDLLDADWWRQRQDNIRAGRLEDVFPYQMDRRFRRREEPGASPPAPGASLLQRAASA